MIRTPGQFMCQSSVAFVLELCTVQGVELIVRMPSQPSRRMSKPLAREIRNKC
jgi:hypothetical protein